MGGGQIFTPGPGSPPLATGRSPPPFSLLRLASTLNTTTQTPYLYLASEPNRGRVEKRGSTEMSRHLSVAETTASF